MKTKTVNLDEATRDILMRSSIEGNRLTLPGQLARADYMKVAKAIEAAGGKWNRQQGCHIFPNDVRETLDIKNDSVSVVNVQQTLQSFYTPPELARVVVQWAGIMPGDSVLEPSAGTGNLLKAIGRDDLSVRLTAVEIDENRKELASLAHHVHYGDFLEFKNGTYDRIIMNPPFTRGQDIKHVQHALTMLKPGGRLVAIVSASQKTRDTFQPIASHWHDIESGAFKESGTKVRTALVVIEV